jgi:L-gulonolactone oxidase
VRVAGACHSPNDSVMTGDTIISLARMSGIHSIAASSGLVECGGGTTLHTLNAALASAGLALPCLGSISDQTVAGAMATGTHGTGVGHGVLSTALVALELVTGSGEVLQLSRGGTGSAATAFQAALCSLGVLGVVTRVTLQAVPAFDLSVQEGPATLARILATSPQALAASAPYYRFWWIPHTDRVWEWRAHPVPPAQPAAASGGLLAGLARTCSAAVAWFWGMAIGYHALQGLLRASQLAPWLLPRINALYAFLFFRRPKAHTARSDLAFNFNCLFKQ